MDRNDHYEQDKIETAITLGMAALKEQVQRLELHTDRTLAGLDQRLESLFNRINDGITSRIIILEQQMKGIQSLKTWLAVLLSTLVAAMVLGFFTNYNSLQAKSQQFEQQLKSINDQIGQRFRPPAVPNRGGRDTGEP